MEYTLSAKDKALVDLLWPYMKRDREHKDRVHTAYGTKTQYGLARCIEAVFREYEDIEPQKGICYTIKEGKTMDTNTITLEQFIAEQQLEMSVLPVKRNPHMSGDQLPRNFECTITMIGRGYHEPMTVYFSQGSAHKKSPTLADVLACLASDASGVDNARSFEDWASEYGYDTDSRKAEKTYNICVQQAQELKALLGQDVYDQLLYGTERL